MICIGEKGSARLVRRWIRLTTRRVLFFGLPALALAHPGDGVRLEAAKLIRLFDPFQQIVACAERIERLGVCGGVDDQA